MKWRKTKRKSIQYPLGRGVELPSELDSAELDSLVSSLRSGTLSGSEETAVKEKIILGHLKLIVSIVSQAVWRAEYLERDMIQEAMLGAVEAVDRAKTRLVDNNITPYISETVKGKLSDFIGNQFIVPARSRRHRLQGLTENEKQKVEFPVEVKRLPSNKRTYKEDKTGEILDQLEKCIQNEVSVKKREYKKAIVQMRAASYDNPEIAEVLGLSERWVKKLMQEIREEFNRPD